MNTLKTILEKYLYTPFWILFSINVLIYLILIFIEYRFILTSDYHELFTKPMYAANEDYLADISEQKKFEIYNYLWSPIHVAIQLTITTLCFFIGFNAINIFVRFKEALRATMAALIIFPINNFIVTTLLAVGVIPCNPNSIDDIYFFQSLGRLFVNYKLPDIVFALMQNINLVEIIFCLLVSYFFALILKSKYFKTLLQAVIIYSLGTVIYVVILQFCEYFFN